MQDSPMTTSGRSATPGDFVHLTLDDTNFSWLGSRYKGKVRDVYDRDDGRLALVTTDRTSAFDISWCSIPLKGQVLSQLSSWWFNRTKDILPNHLVACPDPNVTITKKLTMFPVEVIVRSYLTGSTETSIWVNYARGTRLYCGHELPDGMVRNQALAGNIVTPTTKGVKDELIDAATVVSRGLATQTEWKQICDYALALFAAGQEIARQQGLILVDTKFEFGKDASGQITIGDEILTPDSSRYWMAKSYDARFAAGLEPASLDKEFLRLWLTKRGFDPKHPDQARPEITDDVRTMLASKYIELYQQITGERFIFPQAESLETRITRNMREYFAKD